MDFTTVSSNNNLARGLLPRERGNKDGASATWVRVPLIELGMFECLGGVSQYPEVLIPPSEQFAVLAIIIDAGHFVPAILATPMKQMRSEGVDGGDCVECMPEVAIVSVEFLEVRPNDRLNELSR